MKQHSEEFKKEIKNLGRMQDVIISYTKNGEEVELGVEDINGITPNFESSLLKSVMKELDIDSNIDIPLNTEINFKWGLYVNGAFEYLNFGNYIVYSSEKQEDTNSYNIVCYDKLLNSMKDYEAINLQYPVTVRSYISALASRLGLLFKNANETFPNYDKQIESDLFVDIGYKYRDVLDDLAEVTGRVICLDTNDNLELRKINDTGDTIDEEFLKDTDVAFGEVYGPINSVVLSRSESDNVYLRDENSVTINGLTEIKISDNQIMNFNNRSEFLPDLLEELNGITYNLNDFSSTGILYYDLMDRYSVKVGEKTYSCVMFNDEVDITQGIEEQIYTEIPETAETDYSKADKTDLKINQTNLIVNKQEQTITGLITQNEEFENKLTQVEQTVDQIQQQVSDTITYKREVEGTTQIYLEDSGEQEILNLEIQGNKTYYANLFPATNLYPSANLQPNQRR